MNDRHNAASPGSCAPVFYEHGYLRDDQNNVACSSSENSEFLGTHDDILGVESCFYQPRVTGKPIDPRLFVLLQYFRGLCVIRKGELFRKIFPGVHDEFVDFFKKISQMLSQVKSRNQTRGVRTLQRSLSVGSPRSRSVEGDESPLRLERFKIRTVVVDGVDQGGGQQGDTMSDSSK